MVDIYKIKVLTGRSLNFKFLLNSTSVFWTSCKNVQLLSGFPNSS